MKKEIHKFWFCARVQFWYSKLAPDNQRKAQEAAVFRRVVQRIRRLLVSQETGKPRLWLMVLIALALRLAVMAFLYDEQLSPERDHWRFGYETGRIARSIAQGDGFSSPLFGNTGPTAMLPPVYPYIVAGFFKIFGIYTTASALAILSFQALISALTCLPVYFIAHKSFGGRAALWAGWGWAFFPYAVYFPVERIWGTWLATLLLSLLFLMVLRFEESRGLWTWAGFGLLWALAALTEPVVLSVLLPLTAWCCYRLHKKRAHWAMGVATAALVFAVVIAPWFIRNYEVFHRVIPFRDGFGLALILGAKADTTHWATYHAGVGPWHSDSEWNEFQRLGEPAYMDRERELALASIRNDPSWFEWRSLRRMVFLWTGFWSLDRGYLAQEPLDLANIPVCTALTLLALVGLRRAIKNDPGTALPYLCMLIFFPLIYYITSPEVYYRRPIDPALVVLAAYALISPRRLLAGTM